MTDPLSLSSPPLVVGDAETRRQAVDDLLSNLFVEAGAGTGKTTLLVQRIGALLAEGEPVGSIAAITFTEKAAAELRDRLRTALAAQPGLAAQLDDATLTTIHGFARTILANHALAAGLPPEFRVLSELESSIDFDDQFGRFADDLLDDPGDLELPLRIALTAGATRQSLATLTHSLDARRDLLTDVTWVAPHPLPDPEPLLAAAREIVEHRHRCSDPADLLFGHLDSLVDRLDELAHLTDDLAELHRALGRIKFSFANGKALNWPADMDKDTVKGLLGELDVAREAFRAAVGGHVVQALLPKLAQFVVQQAKRRRDAGALDFTDLLVECRRLLATNRAALEDCRQRWTHLLVDEFQDTDGLQLDIITMIASIDDDPGDVPWAERTLAAGALFAVGDPKQSIYRFRGADMALYRAAADQFGAGATWILDRNFRSVPGVLGWVNSVMADLFQIGAEQAQFRPLTPARAADTAGALVEFIGAAPIDGPAAQVRACEAEELASALGELRRRGLTVGSPPHRRPMGYRDIAVLMPTRTNLAAIEAAFDAAEIPFRVESRSLVFSTTEVRTVAMVLRAVDDPADEIAVVGALRSPAFGCTDTELVQWRQAGRPWSPFAVTDQTGSVAAALVEIRELHDRRWWQSLDRLVVDVIDRCHLREVALAYRRPRDRWRRLQLVIDNAIAFEAAGGRQLRAFVDWLDNQREIGALELETVIADSDDDAVRVMTVHAAKGLEFPVVALAGLGSPPVNLVPPVLWNVDGPRVRLGRKDLGLEHREFEAAGSDHRQLDAAEQQRVLYVASTRARDRLIVCLHRRASRDSSSAQRLHALLQQRPDDWASPIAQLSLPVLPPLVAPRLPAGTVDRAVWLERQQRARANMDAPVVSATALAAGGLPDVDDERPPWRRGRAGTSIGRAVHAVLQSVDLATGDGLDAAVSLQCDAERISHLTEEVRTLVSQVLAAPVVAEAAASAHWREVFVAAPVVDVLAEGFIDLLFARSDGSLVIVDYKTDGARSADDIDAAVARYRRQGAAYALMVETVLQRPVSDVVFVFARASAAARQRSLVDLRAAVAEVRAAVVSSALSGDRALA